MPRWGQASRRANGRSCESRPSTRGISSSVAFSRRLLCKYSAGSARYQKPGSMSESGVWRWGESSNMRDRRGYYSAVIRGNFGRWCCLRRLWGPQLLSLLKSYVSYFPPCRFETKESNFAIPPKPLTLQGLSGFRSSRLACKEGTKLAQRTPESLGNRATQQT